MWKIWPLGCVVLTLSTAPVVARTVDEVVATTTGKVQGMTEEGVLSWKGIPFAAPPVGELRWRAPQPAKAWTGILPVTSYRNDCMQKPVPSDAAPLGAPPAEDCLYANIWRPAKISGRLPVVVWIYGGAFVNGGSSSPAAAGANMARKGVLFFSFNYRLGRFGTFAHPDLTRENADAGLLGNYGYMDQLAALRWVQKNIAAFGGDPRNVTIIGESAGGVSVNNWLTSPLGKGLFQKAVVMSGGNGEFLSGGTDLGVEEQVGVAFAKKKGMAANDPRALARLRALSAEEVTDGLNMSSMRAIEPRTYSSPFADGKVAVRQVPAFQSGAFAHVPVMIGATSADIGGRSGIMIAGARDLAGIISGHGVPVYYYRFSYVAPAQGNPKSGARHATDVPFFLDNAAIRYEDKTTPRDVEMGHIISRYVVNFAKTGDPNGRGLQRWKPFGPKMKEIMDFNREGKAVQIKDPWES